MSASAFEPMVGAMGRGPRGSRSEHPSSPFSTAFKKSSTVSIVDSLVLNLNISVMSYSVSMSNRINASTYVR